MPGSTRSVAVVGVGAVLPDAPDAAVFWRNLTEGRYSIGEVPENRWDPNLYYDPDPHVPDKTYSRIGGWVRDFVWSPLEWRLPVPPKVSDAMDRTQKWSVAASRQALLDYGYPDRPLDNDRTAVILGNAMAGDLHYLTALRCYAPEYQQILGAAPSFAALDPATREALLAELLAGARERFPVITEDSMPGELGNIIAGRVANLFNLHGPNFIADAACASALAAIDAAVEGLEAGDYDAVLTGGIDANMSASSFVKFSAIGALSATGTRPYHDGADGFVMGEGAAVFLLKRLADAEADGDHIYAVIRGIGGSSDGKGKGITAPNPIGQEFAISRAWQDAGLVPDSATYIEGHGTSTRVGDVVETSSLSKVFAGLGLPPATIPLGSVKSNIGHLKSAAGAAGLLKTIMALDHKVIPPSLGDGPPNPMIDFDASPLFINSSLREWSVAPGQVRSAGVSAFGFGGTNFHVVVEEHIPGRIRPETDPRSFAVSAPAATTTAVTGKAPLRGALVVGGASDAEVLARLRDVAAAAARGSAPAPAAPSSADLGADVRVAIDYADAAELATKAGKAVAALESGNPVMWKALRNQGVFLGRGPAPRVAFLFTGQGSQYVNMLRTLAEIDPVVAETIAESDRITERILGRPLSSIAFADPGDPAAVATAEAAIRQTEITQPAVLTTDLALTRLLASYGVSPDMVMGHSLGEYGALVAAGAMPFADALEAVAARGHEMTAVSVGDNGLMAAVFAPLEEIQATLDAVDDYVVIANLNSTRQAVIGGSTTGVTQAMERLTAAGHQVIQLPVSHAFHTEIVAPAAGPLTDVLRRLHLESPAIPLVGNVTGDFYPTGPNVVPAMIELLGRQIASPVQFVAGLRTLYDAGCRVFVEVGPKRALHGLVEDVLGGDPDVSALFTNHPKQGDVVSFNQALTGLYAAGFGAAAPSAAASSAPTASAPAAAAALVTAAPAVVPARQSVSAPVVPAAAVAPAPAAAADDVYARLGHVFADALAEGARLLQGTPLATPAAVDGAGGEPVVIMGAGLALPGRENVFAEDNVSALLHGQSFIDAIPVKRRQGIVDRHITRLVKSESGGGRFEAIDSVADVMKLAGRAGRLDVTADFGVPAELVAALDRTTMLAIGVGLDALRDAGIPLVMRYKMATTGRLIPDRWMLPEAYRDTTGVIFGSAFPGADALIEELNRFYLDKSVRERIELLEALIARFDGNADPTVREDLQRRLHELQHAVESDPYLFDRKFLFRVLAMGHSQFAQYIGARGPNTQVNAACASTTQAVAIAEDWIRSGRCERVVIVSADDVTSDTLLDWVGAGFLATGAAATDEVVEEAALPFDRRRHGMLLGMGAAALVVEQASSARTRGIRPIAQVLATETANSAFHGTRLDVDHIRNVMAHLVATAEGRWGVRRDDIAGQTVFVSHETYTPARGGSAQAEVDALRHVFGPRADRVVIANTKGFTGHAMGAGVEDVLAVKALETGVVPPVPNHKEIDPDLGSLNLSRGGSYPVQYALRLGAGFGSQIAMTLYRAVPSPTGHPDPDRLGYENRLVDPTAWRAWLSSVTGLADPTPQTDHRVLRVRDDGPPVRTPAAAPAAPAVTPAVAPAATVQQVVATPVAPAAVAVAPAAAPVAPVAAPAAAAPVPAPAAVPAPVVAEPAVDPVEAAVLALVAEQTGYPQDLLDVDLDLEADLGIDTVKQAETFAAIRAKYDIPRDDNLALRDYPTLRAVIGFVRDKAPNLPAPVVAVAPAGQGGAPVAVEPAAPAAAGVDPVETAVLALVAEQTGYPQDLLDLDLDLEADLGIDTVKQAETFAAIRAKYDIPRDDNLALRDYPTLRAVIGFVRDKAPNLPAPVAAPVTAAAATAAVVAPLAAPAPAVAGVDPVEAAVLALVSQQTGYPEDLLDLDLDLEADLGIDTVKQAETFAAIRAKYDIPRDDNLALRDYPTLRAVIGFVRDKAPNLPAAVVPAPAATLAATVPAPAAPAAPGGVDPVEVAVLEVVSAQTGYPTDLLDLDLDLEADLGIDTVKQAETFAAIRAKYDIPRDDNLALRDYPTLRAVIGFVRDRAPGLAAAPVAASAAPAAPAGVDPVEVAVLEVVSAQTGYPTDLLDLDLDLEADLGIDTVKQAETFAAIRAKYDIPRDDNLALRDYPTLRAVIGFVRDRAPGLPAVAPDVTGDVATEGAASLTMSPVTSGSVGADALAESLIRGDDEAAMGIPRRIPTPVLRPALDRCIPTGIVLEGARIVVGLDDGGVGRALVSRLEARGAVVHTIDAGTPSDDVARIAAELAIDGVTGVYWLPALDVDVDLTDTDLAGWHESLRLRVTNLYTLMRALEGTVGGEGSFLVSATRLGGYHGYDPEGARAPQGGAVVGFTKAYHREHPDALVKAVDIAVDRKTAAHADALIAETLADPGVVEVGLADDARWTVGLVETPLPAVSPEDGPAITLGPDSVVVVTGAAGAITSAITADVARAAGGGHVHLLDLVAEPVRDDVDIRAFAADKDGLRRTLAARLKADHDRVTPVMVEKELSRIERNHDALALVLAIEAAGATPHWHQVDLRDAEQVGAAVAAALEHTGRVDLLLHAGGIEISRKLADKSPDEFGLVLDIKADGWFNLMSALADARLGAVVAFSSVAGRFGNNGQTDYSAANDLLCKSISALRRTRPETLGVAIDWTAWGDIGMATRGSIPTVMKAAGIDMLPARAGVPIVRREVTLRHVGGEVVIGQRLGLLMSEAHPTGGLAVDEGDDADVITGTALPWRIRSFGAYDGLVADALLDPTGEPFLDHHRIDGTAVLPGVMGIEAFAEVSQLACPGHVVVAVEDVEFMAPFKFYRDEPRTVTVHAVVTADGEELLAHCRLTGERLLAGQETPQRTTHFTATVRLSRDAEVPEPVEPVELSGAEVVAEDVYKVYFHGPAYQVLDRAARHDGGAAGAMAAGLPPNHTRETDTVTDPRLTELAFQTAGVHEIGTTGVMALPMHLDRVVPYAHAGEAAVVAVVRPRKEGDVTVTDADVIDADGRLLVTLEGYRTSPLPAAVPDPLAEPLRRAMYEEA